MRTTKTVTVLLVEDNPIDVESVHRAFAKAKIANPIVEAGNGEDALQLLRAGKVPKPFLVITDINMPRMNGLEMIRALREDPELRGLVVFVLTTSTRERDKTESYDVGVAGYISKHRAGSDFLQLTQMLDSYWRVVELPS